eukprot:scaffold22808_cov34-Phaeocystis_antarctica.AAC.1
MPSYGRSLARAGRSHSRDAMARAVAVHDEHAQPQGHCRAPRRATDLPGGPIAGRWVRAPRAAHRSSIRRLLLISSKQSKQSELY